MPAKKRPPEKPETQFERFVKTAREVGVDEKEAERAFEALNKRKRPSGDSKKN